MKRRICWPNPGKVCLEGGCLYCDHQEYRDEREIRLYAYDKGLMTAFEYGWENNRGGMWVRGNA